MDKLFERIVQLETKLNTVISILRQIPTTHNTDLGEWLTEEQAQELIQRGATSLWALRKKRGGLKFSKIGNRTYYCRKSILAFIEKNKV